MQTQASPNVVSSTMKGIDVSKIEHELSSLWQQATGDDKKESAGSGVTRACVLNLLVYTTAGEERVETEKILDEAMEHNPCRALVLVADETAGEAKLEAHVSSRSRVLDSGATQICGEQVTVEASGAATKSVASAFAPLLVPDVPVFLWWKDIPHYEDKLFDRMTAMADRLVIDSCAFDHPHDDLKRLAALIKERPDFVRVTDLNWGRLTTWRTLIAGFWDVQDYRPILDKIDRVTVEYDAPDAAPTELAANALLITGWLASRLKWTIDPAGYREANDAKQFTLRASDGHPINVELRPSANKQGNDGLLGSVTVANEASRAKFYVGLSSDGKKLETEASIGDEHNVGRVLGYEARTEGQRLSRELNFLARDAIYETAVASAAGMLNSIK